MLYCEGEFVSRCFSFGFLFLCKCGDIFAIFVWIWKINSPLNSENVFYVGRMDKMNPKNPNIISGLLWLLIFGGLWHAKGTPLVPLVCSRTISCELCPVVFEVFNFTTLKYLMQWIIINEFKLRYILRIPKMKFSAFGRGYPCNDRGHIEPQCNKWSLPNSVQVDWHLEECRPRNLFTGIIEDGHAYGALPSAKKQEAQLMLTTGSTRLAVSRGQQTWYYSTCYI